MNIFEKLIEKIKKMLSSKEHPHMLVSGSFTDIEKSKQNSFKSDLSSNKQGFLISSPTTIEYGVDQYIKELTTDYQNNFSNHLTSYEILNDIWDYHVEPSNGNLAKEQKFLSNNKPNLSIHRQFEPLKAVLAYYHIYGNNPDFKNIPLENKIRLYVNLQRSNIVDFSLALIEEFGEEQFYFKFVADDYVGKHPGAETLVIYAHKDNVTETIQHIRNIKKIFPDLLSGSNIIRYFMKTDGFIGYAPEVDKTYYTENNSRGNISQPFIAVLAPILEKSFVVSIQEMLKQNKKLQEELDYKSCKNLSDAITLYELLPDEMNLELIERIIQHLNKSSARNIVLPESKEKTL